MYARKVYKNDAIRSGPLKLQAQNIKKYKP